MQRSFCILLMLLMHTLQTHAQNGRIAWDEVGIVYAQEKFQRTYRAYLETYGEYVSPLEPVRFQVASDSYLDGSGKLWVCLHLCPSHFKDR